MFKLNNSVRLVFVFSIMAVISACSSPNLFQKDLESSKVEVKVEPLKSGQAENGSKPSRTPNNLSPFILNAVERVSRVSGLSNSDRQYLISILKQMKQQELLAIEMKCKDAFDNLTPSKCDELLRNLM